MLTTATRPSTRTTGTATARPDPAGRAGSRPTGPAGTRPGRGRGRPGGAPRRPVRLQDLAATFALLYLEVESGRRPPRQVVRLMDPRLAAQLERIWVRPGEPGQVVSVTGQRTGPASYEAVAVVRRGRRCGALALRLARRGGRWVVAEAIRPEDGVLPDPPFSFPAEGVDAFDLVGESDATCAEAGHGAPMTIAL